MDAREFLGLEATHNPHRWMLPVTPGISTAGDFLFGGCGLGAAIAAMEATTGRTTIWATAQYLSYARPPEVMDVDVTLATVGHHVTQARAVGHVVDREILTVNAALGERAFPAEGAWETMPKVPPPQDCPLRGYRPGAEQSLMRRLDVRMARARDFHELDGRPGDGRAALWARVPIDPRGSGDPAVLEMSAATLAILGDYVPFGVGQSLGQLAGGNSLDNTLRLVHLVPTEWVLLDIRVHAVQRGFGHGLVHLWAEDGTLLATASQSCIVRFWRDEDRRRIREEFEDMERRREPQVDAAMEEA